MVQQVYEVRVGTIVGAGMHEEDYGAIITQCLNSRYAPDFTVKRIDKDV